VVVEGLYFLLGRAAHKVPVHKHKETALVMAVVEPELGTALVGTALWAL
jgi:hypothetical protein